MTQLAHTQRSVDAVALVRRVCDANATSLHWTEAVRALLPRTGALPATQLCHVALATCMRSNAGDVCTATLPLLRACAERLLDTAPLTQHKDDNAMAVDTAALREGALRAAVALRTAVQSTLALPNDTAAHALCGTALTQCVERAVDMSLFAVAVAYGGVALMQREHLTLPFDDTDADPGRSVDMLCRELEHAVRLRCAEATENAATRQDGRSVCELVAALATVGVHDAKTLASLVHMLQQHERRLRRMLDVPHTITMMLHASSIEQRVDDVLAYDVAAAASDTAVAAADAVRVQREALVRLLATSLLQCRRVVTRALQGDLHLVVRLRRAYEASASLYACAPELWDVARCIRVPNRVVQRPHGSARERGGGALFRSARLAAPQRGRVTREPTHAERYVPPQFRRHRERARPHQPGAARRMRFGVRKIAAGYTQRLQRKYTPK